VVKGDRLGGNAGTAISAHRAVPLEQPIAMRTVRASGRATKAGTAGTTTATGVCCWCR
jgi:hypothetical protein